MVGLEILREGLSVPSFLFILFDAKTKKATLQTGTYFYRNFGFLGKTRGFHKAT